MGVCAYGRRLRRLTPLKKTDEKLKRVNVQKEHFSVLQNARFRSQIFKIFFASCGKGALTWSDP